MNKKDNQKKKGSVIPVLVILGIILLRGFGDDPEAAAMFIGFLVVGAIIAMVIAAAKKAGGKKAPSAAPQPVRAAGAAKPVKAANPVAERPHGMRHQDEIEAEEAIHCAHVRGKEKYIQQLDSYLKAGLIDRAEYKVMKERYEKLDIPDDYH